MVLSFNFYLFSSLIFIGELKLDCIEDEYYYGINEVTSVTSLYKIRNSYIRCCLSYIWF